MSCKQPWESWPTRTDNEAPQDIFVTPNWYPACHVRIASVHAAEALEVGVLTSSSLKITHLDWPGVIDPGAQQKRCANPKCWFFISGCDGGYCCTKCHWRHVTCSKTHLKRRCRGYKQLESRQEPRQGARLGLHLKLQSS